MEAVAWARDVLGDLGRDVLGVELVRHRAWSTVWRVDADGGPLFLKTAPPEVSAEPALLDVLARHGVPHVQRPIAVSGRHVLLPDGGGIVRDAPDRDDVWRRVLTNCAVVQRAAAPLVDELVRAGVPDLRLPVLPEVATGLVDRWAPEHRSGVRTVVQDAVDELADRTTSPGPVPVATVEHSDLHDGNAFARGAVPFDWGDACVGHPFMSLLVAGDQDVPGAVAGYLETMTGSADAAADPDVVRAVALARRLAAVPRALSWQRAIDAAGESMPEEYRGAARAWVLRLLED